MNKVCVELSDEAMADLQEAQLQLRTLWKGTPGMEDREVTEADAMSGVLMAPAQWSTRGVTVLVGHPCMQL